MIELKYLIAFSAAPLFALSQLSAPGELDPSTLPTRFSNFHIDRITDGPTGVTVHGAAQLDGKRLVIWCGVRGPHTMLAISNREDKTDDRMAVKEGFCDALLTAARQRQQTQGR